MNHKKTNNRIFKILDIFGDDLSKKRAVTHWFYFEEFDKLEQFESYANDIGFDTMHKDLNLKNAVSNKLLLLLVHLEKPNPNQIDFDTFNFFDIAPKYNGVYDGWETSVEFDS